MTAKELLYYKIYGKQLRTLKTLNNNPLLCRGNSKPYLIFHKFWILYIIEETYPTDWNKYLKALPLWSNINTNCYFKLKENNK